MDTVLGFLVPIIFAAFGYTASGFKVVNEGNEALVERLGKFNRKLGPGVNFVWPYLETIVLEDTVREQVLDVPPQNAITKDNVAIKVDAVVYWKIVDLRKAYYEINNVDLAIKNLTLTTLRSTIGQMKLQETFYSTDQINKSVLTNLDKETASWGLKVLRIEVQDLDPPATVLESMEQEQAAEIKKRAAILEAEATAEAMAHILQTLDTKLGSEEILKYLIAKRYVDANEHLGKSPNSKVIFMDPKALSQALAELIQMPPHSPSNNSSNGNSPNGGNSGQSQP
ncbi:SPFH domain-containing protein [Oxynema aestuarii]|jgi:regulator of protease activity HflC (stomatin/prohibitin superfamily)|uniref:Paraslipin n=1 Tax=Oxynema aestuarii AP17 TaxID=2064643 RepID=A0A6H1U0D7_9CYAN|nr:stomatin-like protein [Oxynema aestuarii]QIZ71483.1 paraslipin [Oxynema aestuarii AP17]RMH78995.1 MAG: paraslipin [Cyanobacteria bacterium J007]